ncbi:unnamed protein product [Rotaria sp. Silwood2]|nr:unnamed protein product [Rotaria sp. Silwood2]CAF3410576.1 unnamed protein product [Rotaria sp. Silwood2]CAF4638630.1 unnamed protein product [Rotaria sp. Silwood2]
MQSIYSSFFTTDTRDVIILRVTLEYSINVRNTKQNFLFELLIVFYSKQHHRVICKEQNTFEPNKLVINQYDQVWFNSISMTFTNIYQIDQYGNHLKENKQLFQSQLNNMNNFMPRFRQTEIYYFSNVIKANDRRKPCA